MDDHKPHLVIHGGGKAHILPIGLIVAIAEGRHDPDDDTIQGLAYGLLGFLDAD